MVCPNLNVGVTFCAAGKENDVISESIIGIDVPCEKADGESQRKRIKNIASGKNWQRLNFMVSGFSTDSAARRVPDSRNADKNKLR